MACAEVKDLPATDWKAEALKSVSSAEQSQVCEPYPAFLRKADGEKDFIGAEHIMGQIPPLSRLSQQASSLPLLSLRLIAWLQETKKVKLRSIPVAEFPLRASFAGDNNPHLVFEITHSPSAEMTQFEQLRREYGSTLAFHGSALHNWYSIVSNGLSTSFSRPDESIYGDGIYLSTEPSVAMNFRRSGRTWCQSSLGESLSCLLVAEVLHHPASVARSEADGPNGKQMPGVSLDHRLPRSYILVKNNLHVRARYLILWRQTAPSRSAKWWLLLVLYALVLLFIALAKSNPRWLRRAIVQADKYL